MAKLATSDHPELKMFNPRAAAIDIGSTMHIAAVKPDASDTPVRALRTGSNSAASPSWSWNPPGPSGFQLS